MPTLVLSPRYTKDSIALWKSAIALNWEVTRLPNWQLTSPSINDPVIYGEPLFAKIIADRLSVKLLDPDLDWLVTLPTNYLKRRVIYTTLAEARISETMFIKPAADKSFPAKVYQSGKQLPTVEALPDDTPVLASEPVEWEIEFRCFVQKRTLLAISSYWSNGDSTEQADGSWYATEKEYRQAAEFCTEVISNSQVKLPDAVVVDVGIIKERGWAVIEANSVYSSGLYGCDPTVVIKVIQTGTLPI